uniref:Putative metalloprotease n=1 Tax=Ixodes ricinus TaxID=34613 RepID=A0A0K8RHZ5_IXORI
MFKIILVVTLLQRCARKCYAKTTKPETVFPSIMDARSSPGGLLLAIRDGFTLSLQKASVFSNQVRVSTVSNDSEITLDIRGEDLESKLYQDKEKHAALIVTGENGVQVYGIIGRKVIKPLFSIERKFNGRLAHELTQIPEDHFAGFDDDAVFLNTKPEHLSPTNITKHFEARQEKTDVLQITPEVHIMLDSVFTSGFNNKSEMLDYLSIIIATANLKFRTIAQYLDLQLVVTAVTSYTNNTETFVESPPEHPKAMVASSLHNLLDFTRKNKNYFQDDDLIVLITGRDIAMYNETTRELHSQDIAGHAYLGGACGSRNVGMVEDPPRSFKGTLTFVHEVGHMLGSVHDGGPADPVIRDHPGALSCPERDEYIMSFISTSRNRHRFSKCSSLQILVFATNEEGCCLIKKAQRHTEPVDISRVQKWIDPQMFCKLRHPNIEKVTYVKEIKRNLWHKPDFQYPPGIKKCQLLCETVIDSKVRYYGYDAPDGTPCNEKNMSMVCVNKVCTEPPTNMTTFKESRVKRIHRKPR